MKKHIVYIIFFCFNLYPLGFDALYIPSNPTLMSLSGSGLASRAINSLNPASNISKDTYISFSNNRWTEDIKGNSFYYVINGFQFDYYGLGVDDIELRNDIPSDDPLDIIESHFLSFGVSKGYNIFEKFKVGFGVNFNYSQLFTDKLSALTLDFGVQKSLSDNFQLGMMIKNLTTHIEVPKILGIGMSYYNLKTKSEMLLDFQYSKENNSGIGIHAGLIQPIKMFTFNLGYSKYSNARTTISSGVEIDIGNNYKFLYSILSLQETNLGLAHYFGIQFSL